MRNPTRPRPAGGGFLPAGRIRRYFWQHPRAMDLLVCAMGGIFCLSSMGASLSFTSSSGHVDYAFGRVDLPAEVAVFIDLMAAAVTIVALWLRRTRPVLCVLLVAGANLVAVPLIANFNFVSAVLAAYAVAAYAQRRLSIPAMLVLVVEAVATALAGGLTATVHTEGQAGELVTSIMLLVLEIPSLLFAYSLGRNTRSRRMYMRTLEERATLLAYERDQQAIIATQVERNRIAREMHDVVAHSLTVMITLAEGANAAMNRSTDAAHAALDQLTETGRTALTDMRRVLGALCEDTADLRPIRRSVIELVEDMRATGRHITLTISGPPNDTAGELAVYRIVQESLTNALRHSPPDTPIVVVLDRGPSDVVVSVTNHIGDRVLGQPGGRGLIGMRERVAVLGGQVTAGPVGGRWVVHARIPAGPPPGPAA